jgi:hypothetical protein
MRNIGRGLVNRTVFLVSCGVQSWLLCGMAPRNLAPVLGQHGPSARSLGGAGSQGEWKGVQPLPQLCQPMPDVTVFGEMRMGAMVCGRRDQLIYRITPLELWIKPLAKLGVGRSCMERGFYADPYA